LFFPPGSTELEARGKGPARGQPLPRRLGAGACGGSWLASEPGSDGLARGPVTTDEPRSRSPKTARPLRVQLGIGRAARGPPAGPSRACAAHRTGCRRRGWLVRRGFGHTNHAAHPESARPEERPQESAHRVLVVADSRQCPRAGEAPRRKRCARAVLACGVARPCWAAGDPGRSCAQSRWRRSTLFSRSPGPATTWRPACRCCRKPPRCRTCGAGGPAHSTGGAGEESFDARPSKRLESAAVRRSRNARYQLAQLPADRWAPAGSRRLVFFFVFPGAGRACGSNAPSKSWRAPYAVAVEKRTPIGGAVPPPRRRSRRSPENLRISRAGRRTAAKMSTRSRNSVFFVSSRLKSSCCRTGHRVEPPATLRRANR